MIKASELRIGDIIEYEKNTHIVCGIKGNMIYSWWFKDGKSVKEEIQKDISGVLVDDPYFDFCENHNPIPLTSEIMQRCGFVRNGNYWDKGFFELPIYPKKDGSEFILVPNGKIAAIELKYLHQLQNLYFSLTSEELEIKELQSA